MRSFKTHFNGLSVYLKILLTFTLAVMLIMSTTITHHAILDSDGDGLTDYDEINGDSVNGFTSDPFDTDSDNDGLSD